jgi:hypothetical protein
MSKPRKKQSGRNARRNRNTKERQSLKSKSRIKSEDFNPDYTQVMLDMRRIGILAGSFLIVLIVLSFFLN